MFRQTMVLARDRRQHRLAYCEISIPAGVRKDEIFVNPPTRCSSWPIGTIRGQSPALGNFVPKVEKTTQHNMVDEPRLCGGWLPASPSSPNRWRRCGIPNVVYRDFSPNNISDIDRRLHLPSGQFLAGDEASGVVHAPVRATLKNSDFAEAPCVPEEQLSEI